MNIKNCLLLLLLLPSLAIAGSVENNAGRKINKKTEKELERKKEILNERSKKALSSKTKQKIKQLGLSKQELTSYRISSEVPLSTFLTPAIAEIEGELQKANDKNLDYIQYLLKRCRLYSDVPVIPSAFPWRLPAMVTTRGGYYKEDAYGWLIGSGEPAHLFIKNKDLGSFNVSFAINDDRLRRITTMDAASNAIGRRIDTPAIPVRCYYAYGRLGEAIIDDLEKSSVSVVKVRSQKSIYLDGNSIFNRDLEKLVRRLLYARLLIGVDKNDVEEFANKSINQGCRLPTLTGLQSGIVDWQCGGFSIDPNSVSAMFGGVAILGGNSYFGKEVTIANVDGQDLAQSYLTSEQSQVAESSSNEKSSSTLLSKRRSSTTGSSSETETGSGSGVTSKGEN